MSVIVTLAAYNEGRTIGTLVREIVALGYDSVVVVDDGSSDDTAAIAREAGARVVRHHVNLGQGHAILTGLAAAMLDRGAEIIVTMDGDGQHAPREIAVFVEKLRSGDADVVVGSRVLGRPAENNHPLRRLFAPFYTGMINRITGLQLTDALTGFRAFRRSSLDRAIGVLNGMLEPQYLTAELLVRLCHLGFRVDEVPVNIRNRAHGVSHKGMFRMGIGIVRAMLRAMLTDRRTSN
jgi:glycosyltransferase involved in cell wall biosynthesis